MPDPDEWEKSDRLPATADEESGGLFVPAGSKSRATRKPQSGTVAASLHDLRHLHGEVRQSKHDGACAKVVQPEVHVESFPSVRRRPATKKRPRSPRRSEPDPSPPPPAAGYVLGQSIIRDRDPPLESKSRQSLPRLPHERPLNANQKQHEQRFQQRIPALDHPDRTSRFVSRHVRGRENSFQSPGPPRMQVAVPSRGAASDLTLASGADLREYEAEQDRAEREWYLGDDASTAAADASFYGTDEQPAGVKNPVRLSAKAAMGHHESARWEQAQMHAGLYGDRALHHRHELQHDDDDTAPRVALLVKHTTPAFFSDADQLLAGPGESRAVVGSDVVMPVKDYTSDMAIVARKGSALVSQYREKRGRGGLNRVKYWELGTTAVGAKAKEYADKNAENAVTETALVHERNAGDWRKDMKFADSIGAAASMSRASAAAADARACAVSAGDDVEVSVPFEKRMSTAEIRRSLPVFRVRDDLLNVIRENQVVVVVGETGSGKTTQLTQYLHDDGYTSYGVVGCTQPRRVAAVSVAQRVSEEFDGGGLGAEVGYVIRFEDRTSPKTCIKYMTDGILLRESLSDPDLDKYSVIIMDEAHERSLNTDVLFGALRTIIARRRDLKVVITSATMNADKFANFFGRAPIFHIPGRTFPVDIFFSKTPVEDYVDGSVWQVMQIHLQAPLPGDILVFMTGQEDIETMCEALADKMAKLESPTPVLILPIYSQLAADLQAKIFEPAPPGVRKVVVATNIAETSLTIDGIRYVVDAGYCKLKTYNPRLGMDALLLCPASQAAVNQRAGRAGRTGPGKCYRLFTASAYASEMLETNVPEIQRTNLSHVVLLLKSLGVTDVLDFPFLDPPPAENVLKSMLGLWYLGALDSNGMLTELGKRMSGFPLDPALSAMLFTGEEFGCLAEATIIVAMLSVPNVFLRPQGREEESDAAREKFFIAESDHLTLLHTFQRWQAAGCRADWSARHFINGKGMRKAREVREQLVEIMKGDGMGVTSCDDWDTIRRAVASSYYYQAARRKGMSDYINVRSGVVCGLHPTSSIYGTGMTPEYVVYHELVFTKKEYMSCVTAVEPQWLASARLGPLLYTIKTARVLDHL
jgi:pre-mRNA-splicing factor ATP-dependent RNA helicase DHX38/PRP16